MKEGSKITLIMGMLIAVLALMLLNTVWPRQTTLSAESMESINKMADSMKQSAANWERVSKSTTELNEVLLAQAKGSRNEINALHLQLLGRYGLDPNDPFSEYVNSVLQQSQGNGGIDLPRGEGEAGRGRGVPEANAKLAGSTDRGSSRVADNGHRATAHSAQ